MSQKASPKISQKSGPKAGIKDALKAGPDLGPETKKPAAEMAFLFDLMAADLTRVDALILERLASPVALIPQIASHIVAAGGKRLRPLLTLASARMFGYHGQRHIAMATIIEFIHTATLLHDDVVDASLLRRGQQSANALWGNHAPVLVGDFLFSRAFQMAVADGDLTVLKILSDASAILAEGEVMQLTTSNNLATTESGYLQVIASKTAVLFAAACQLGAVVAKREEEEIMALRDFGHFFGLAYQLVDDYLDYNASQMKLGKEVGNDFREGKVTLPVILTYAHAHSEKDKVFWRRVIEKQSQQSDDFNEAHRQMLVTGALDQTFDRAKDYAFKAKKSLGIFPDSAEKSALLSLTDFGINRVS